MESVILISLRRLTLIFLCLGTALFLQSCGHDDPGPKGVLLTVNKDPGYYPADFDTWMFISDQNGNTIDVRQASDSTHIEFSGTPHGKLTLTIFNRVTMINGDGTTWTSYGFNSYQEIASGSTIHLRTPANNYVPIPDVIGGAHFTLQNYDDCDKPEEALVISDGTSGIYGTLNYDSNVYVGSNFSSQLRVRANPAKILITTFHNDLPVYKWLDAVIPGQPVTVDYNSFLPAKTITVNKIALGGSVKTMTGADFGDGYSFCELFARQKSKSSNLSVPPKLGYLEGFDKYFVLVVLNDLAAHDNLYYSKAGTIPQSINLPDYSFSITNDNLNGLALTFGNDYSYKQAFFMKSNQQRQVIWTLSAANAENFKAPLIPSAMKKVYPTLNTDSVKFQFGSYTYWPDGYTYSDYVRDYFANTPRDVYEELRYTFMP